MQFPRFPRTMVTSMIIGLLGALSSTLFTSVSSASPLPSPPSLTLAASSASSNFTPGAAWTDSGNALQMHGLGIIKVGSTWYAYGEDKTGETSRRVVPGDPLLQLDRPAHWTYQGDALTEQSSGDLGPDRIVERPKVIYNSSTGEYVMWMHIDNPSYSAAEAGVAESTTPCGPYTYLGASQPLGFQSRDIGLFQDTNGTAYLLTEDRANGLRIDKLSSDYLGRSASASVAVLPDYEAPAMVKVGGTYYLFASHLTGWARQRRRLRHRDLPRRAPGPRSRTSPLSAPTPTTPRPRTSSRSRAAPAPPTSTRATAGPPRTSARSR